MKVGIYEITNSNSRGGKAGRGRNKTASIQVREPIRPGEYLIKKTFRFVVADDKSEREALLNAMQWAKGQ
jgi:hypothetical protein